MTDILKKKISANNSSSWKLIKLCPYSGLTTANNIP